MFVSMALTIPRRSSTDFRTSSSSCLSLRTGNKTEVYFIGLARPSLAVTLWQAARLFAAASVPLSHTRPESPPQALWKVHLFSGVAFFPKQGEGL
jgi:hypothetical protein